MPATSIETSRHLEQIAASYRLTRFSGPGNPLGTEVLQVGEVLATKISFAPNNPFMNSVSGLEDPDLIQPVLQFYATTQQACWIWVPPYVSTAVTDALIGHGFRIVLHSSALVAEPLPTKVASFTDEVDIKQVAREDLDTFLDTMNLGFGEAIARVQTLRRNQSFWCDVPTWHLFLARIRGMPAGAALLSIHDDVGYLAAGSVLPAYRGCGIHLALINARIERAASRHCKAITGRADFGSQSQRNQQRAGLSLTHVTSVWTNCPR